MAWLCIQAFRSSIIGFNSSQSFRDCYSTWRGLGRLACLTSDMMMSSSKCKVVFHSLSFSGSIFWGCRRFKVIFRGVPSCIFWVRRLNIKLLFCSVPPISFLVLWLLVLWCFQILFAILNLRRQRLGLLFWNRNIGKLYADKFICV